MGNTQSNHGSLSKQIDELIKNYTFWTNKDMCNNIELFYRNKIMSFDDIDLINTSISLGYKLDTSKNIDRNNVCNIIINHYKKRIELLQKIDKILKECSIKLYRAKHGNVCLNYDGYIDDFYKCSQIPKSLWIDSNLYQKIITKIKQTNKYDGWAKWINKLESLYFNYIQEIKKVTDYLQNELNNNVAPSKFEIIKNKTELLLSRTATLSDIYYLLAINYLVNS